MTEEEIIKQKILQCKEIDKPIILFEYNESKNFSIYIISSSFYKKDDEYWQNIIWNVLRTLDQTIRNKIIMAIHETPAEYMSRLNVKMQSALDLKKKNICALFSHKSPDQFQYYLMVGSRIDSIQAAHAFYSVCAIDIHGSMVIQEAMEYECKKDVYEFLDQTVEEAKKGLLENAFNYGQSLIQKDLMDKYFSNVDNQIIFGYVFNNFKMTQVLSPIDMPIDVVNFFRTNQPHRDYQIEKLLSCLTLNH